MSFNTLTFRNLRRLYKKIGQHDISNFSNIIGTKRGHQNSMKLAKE